MFQFFKISSIKSTNCCDNYFLETLFLSLALISAFIQHYMLQLCGTKKNTHSFTVISFRIFFFFSNSICDKFSIRTLITKHAAHKAQAYKKNSQQMYETFFCLQHHRVEVSLHKILLPKKNLKKSKNKKRYNIFVTFPFSSCETLDFNDKKKINGLA